MNNHVIGIDLGGTNMQIGVVDAANRIISRVQQKTHASQGADAVIDRIIEGAANACTQAGLALSDISALGIAAPGAIDIPRGVVLEAPNLGWYDLPLRSILMKRLAMPVAVDNDVNGAIWGEHTLGAGQGHDDLLGMWVGTGVGGGLIIGGRIYHGPMFTAGEVGQSIIDPFGAPGERTVEDNCSRTGLSRYIGRRLPQYPDSILHALAERKSDQPGDIVVGSAKLAQAVTANDRLACEAVERAAFLLGVAAANWVTVLSLARIIIGGGVTEALGEPFLQRIRESFEQHVFPQSARRCEIVMTQLAHDSGLLGAALLAQEVVSERATK